jgi:hypothetical protein
MPGPRRKGTHESGWRAFLPSPGSSKRVVERFFKDVSSFHRRIRVKDTQLL